MLKLPQVSGSDVVRLKTEPNMILPTPPQPGRCLYIEGRFADLICQRGLPVPSD
jgi:hypothetical protein